MPQETQDESARDGESSATVLQGPMNPRHNGFKGDASIGMRLRIEEDLGVAHALAGGPGQVSPGQIVEILLLQERAAARVIDVEERWQIAEDVGSADVFD